MYIEIDPRNLLFFNAMSTPGKCGNESGDVRELELLKSADQVQAILSRQQANRRSLLTLFQVISNQMEKPSYGGSLICRDIKKLYGNSVECYSIQNQLCVDIFGRENFKLKNTLKPIYIVVNNSHQILQVCSQNSKKYIVAALELSFKEIEINESPMSAKKQGRLNPSTTHNNSQVGQGNVDDAGNENKYVSQDTKTAEVPFVERKSPAEQYEHVKNALDRLSQLKATDFAGY